MCLKLRCVFGHRRSGADLRLCASDLLPRGAGPVPERRGPGSFQLQVLLVLIRLPLPEKTYLKTSSSLHRESLCFRFYLDYIFKVEVFPKIGAYVQRQIWDRFGDLLLGWRLLALSTSEQLSSLCVTSIVTSSAGGAMCPVTLLSQNQHCEVNFERVVVAWCLSRTKFLVSVCAVCLGTENNSVNSIEHVMP